MTEQELMLKQQEIITDLQSTLVKACAELRFQVREITQQANTIKNLKSSITASEDRIAELIAGPVSYVKEDLGYD